MTTRRTVSGSWPAQQRLRVAIQAPSLAASMRSGGVPGLTGASSMRVISFVPASGQASRPYVGFEFGTVKKHPSIGLPVPRQTRNTKNRFAEFCQRDVLRSCAGVIGREQFAFVNET